MNQSPRAALLVIDMQNGFLNPASAQCIRMAAATVPACAAAIKKARALHIPVFYIKRQYRMDGTDVELCRYASWKAGGCAMTPGSHGPISEEFPPELQPQDTDYVVVKPRFSAFFATLLDMILRRMGIDTVLLTGTTTPNCIRTTCYDALSLDYTVAILPECCSSQTEAIQQANMQDMATIGAFMLPLADFLAQGTGPLLPTWEKEQAARQAIQAPYIQGEEHPAL